MGAITTLYLVRHGESDTGTGPQLRMIGRTDVPLTARGRTQAAAARLRLQREAEIGAVYSSPARRAVETARLIAPASARVLFEPGLWEIDCGAADGLLISEVQRCFPEQWETNGREQDPEFRWPGGESYREFRARCLRAIETIAAACRGSNVLVVTHSGVITQVLNHLCGKSPALWSEPRANNASLTILRWGEGGGELVAFNEIGREVA